MPDSIPRPVHASGRAVFGADGDGVCDCYSNLAWGEGMYAGQVAAEVAVSLNDAPRLRLVLEALGLPADLTPERAALYTVTPPEECSDCGHLVRADECDDIMGYCPRCMRKLNDEAWGQDAREGRDDE